MNIIVNFFPFGKECYEYSCCSIFHEPCPMKENPHYWPRYKLFVQPMNIRKKPTHRGWRHEKREKISGHTPGRLSPGARFHRVRRRQTLPVPAAWLCKEPGPQPAALLQNSESPQADTGRCRCLCCKRTTCHCLTRCPAVFCSVHRQAPQCRRRPAQARRARIHPRRSGRPERSACPQIP